jgi:hypothetical protein
MRPRDRFAVAIGLAVMVCGVAAASLVLWRTTPLAFALAGSFVTPLVVAAGALGGRWLYLVLHGHARLPKPRMRPGRMETRPYTAAQRRRPRT